MANIELTVASGMVQVQLSSFTLTIVFKVKRLSFYLICEYFVNGYMKSKYNNFYQIERLIFTMKLRMLYIMTLTNIFKVNNFLMFVLGNCESYENKKAQHRSWHTAKCNMLQQLK